MIHISFDMIHKNANTPWKINMEPKNHPFRKENDLPNLQGNMFHVNLSGCTYCRSSYHMLILTVPPSQPTALKNPQESIVQNVVPEALEAPVHEVWKVLEDDSLLLIKGSRVGGEREPTEKGGGFKLKTWIHYMFFLCSPPPKKKKWGKWSNLRSIFLSDGLNWNHQLARIG